MNQKKSTGKSREYNPSGRRWWLKLQFAFFSDKRVRALRRKYGDLALIIYQKIMLKSLENDSSMRFEGLEETFEDEIAVDIMEDDGDSVKLIRDIMDFLIQHQLMVEQEDKSYFFPQAAEMSGDESSSAERMRRMRERNREASHETKDSDGEASQSDMKQLHNDSQASQSNEASHCDKESSQRYHIQNQNNNRSRSKARIDLDLELDLKQKTETETEKTDSAFVSAERPASAAADAAAPPAVDLFSLSELLAIRRKHEIDISGEGITAFLAEMHANGWMLYKKPVTKEGIIKALRGWVKYHEGYHLSDDSKMERRIVKVLRTYLSEEETEEFLNTDDTDYQAETLEKFPVKAFNLDMLEYMEEAWGIHYGDD
jgi:hypothetical protein